MVLASGSPQAPITLAESHVSLPALTVEEHVRLYFNDIPVMAKIAACESHFRHYDKDGNVLRGEENSRDVGVMQINEDYHLKKALELGMDLYSLEGNLTYARHLYEKGGTAPWIHSKKCWRNTLAVAN